MMEEQNPWWKGKERILEDPELRRWSESELRWIPSLLKAIVLEPFSLNFIFGPRQVGKTTLIKLLIRRLLDLVGNPKALFYYRCDRLADFKELDKVLEEYLELKRTEGIETSYIFLDEVTFPKEWFRAVKYRIDSGALASDVLTLTGSISMYAKKEIESFPGRRGSGKDIVFHPLSFREFLKATQPEVYARLKRFERLSPLEVRKKCSMARPWAGEMNTAFEGYLRCGGFPLAIKSVVGEGKVSEEAKNAFLSFFISDLVKLKRNEGLAKRVLKAIIEKLPSALSLNSIAKEFEIGSHKTVFYYLDLFEKMFVAKNVHFIEPMKLVEVYYKQRKVHLTDPFLYTVFSEWCMTERPPESAVIESVVAAHLARRLSVGYWKNGTEIDVVIPELRLGLEVKWGRERFGRRSVGKVKDIIFLTKGEFRRNPLAVPVSLFLGCLEV
jgi:hypothetical protein